MTIGQRIAEERKKLGISQEALGDTMGVSRQAISKWESDGAIPEIDKLIGLCKLFGVSVGWLLGVEDGSGSHANDGFSEKQLHLLEEILRKDHPTKQDTRRTLAGRILAGCLIAFSLWAGVMSLAGIADLQNRVAAIEGSHIALPSLNLLADYSFEIRQQADCPDPLISFSATPVSWREGDTAYLDILKSDGTLIHIQCSLSGTFLSAECGLALEDGYSLCFTQLHADGTQDQQVLSNNRIENIQSTLSIYIDTAPVKGTYQDGTLQLDGFWASLSMPCDGLDAEHTKWEQIDLVLEQENEEIGRFHYVDTIEMTAQHYSDTGMMHRNIRFEGLALASNAYIDLYIEAAMSNGITARQHITTVQVDNDGNLK